MANEIIRYSALIILVLATYSKASKESRTAILALLVISIIYRTMLVYNIFILTIITIYLFDHPSLITRVSKSLLAFCGVLLSVLVVLFYLGLLNDVGFSGQGELRYCFGFWNPNCFGLFLLLTIMLSFFCNMRFLFGYFILLYILTYNTHRSLTGLVLLGVLFIMLLIPSKEHILKGLTVVSYFSGFLIIFIIDADEYLFNYYGFDLDEFLSKRVTILREAKIQGSGSIDQLLLGFGDIVSDTGWWNIIYGFGLFFYIIAGVMLFFLLQRVSLSSNKKRLLDSMIILITIFTGTFSEMYFQNWNYVIPIVFATLLAACNKTEETITKNTAHAPCNLDDQCPA